MCEENQVKVVRSCPAKSARSAQSKGIVPDSQSTERSIYTNARDTEDTSERYLPLLYQLRDPVVEYQYKRGIPKNEKYTFYKLVYIVGQDLYTAFIAMGYMIFNMVPILDAFLLITRFIIDHVIDILEADENDRWKMAAIFFVEFIPIFFILCFIYGFIIVPLAALFLSLLLKLWHFVS